MAAAGYLVEAILSLLGTVRARTGVTIPDSGHSGASWNCTTWLAIVFPRPATALLVRFGQAGGVPMPRMMGGSPGSSPDRSAHGQSAHDHATHHLTEYQA